MRARLLDLAGSISPIHERAVPWPGLPHASRPAERVRPQLVRLCIGRNHGVGLSCRVRVRLARESLRRTRLMTPAGAFEFHHETRAVLNALIEAAFDYLDD